MGQGGNAVKKKLSFVKQDESTAPNTANMVINETAIITPGNEALKRKLGDGVRVKGCEKLRLVGMEDNTSLHFQDSAVAATHPRMHQ